MKYRKKPVVIEAFRYGYDDMPEWFNEVYGEKWAVSIHGDHMLIQTMEGVMQAVEGDYIIKGIKNEIYPCKSDIFHLTYEKVKEND